MKKVCPCVLDFLPFPLSPHAGAAALLFISKEGMKKGGKVQCLLNVPQESYVCGVPLTSSTGMNDCNYCKFPSVTTIFFFFNFMDEVLVLFIPNNESNRIELVETYLDLLMLIGSNDKDSILLMSILVPSNYMGKVQKQPHSFTIGRY